MKPNAYILIGFIILFMLSLDVSFAQYSLKYAIEVKHDKKIIHPEDLNLPNGTSAYSLLSLLPEILNRSMDSCVDKYEIKIEDVSVEESRDIILTNLGIEDIKEIEISESPITSYEKNGQGGSINITLKDATAKASGYISTIYSNFNYLTPIAYFSIKRKKLSIKAIAAYEYYDPKEINTYVDLFENSNEIDISNYVKTTDHLSNTQMARVYLNTNHQKMIY